MSDIDDMRGMTALVAIQNDIVDAESRSKVISIIRPYIERIHGGSDTYSKDVFTAELAKVSEERAKIFEKITKQSNNLDYSDVEYASVVIKHTFLLATLSSDEKVLDELEKLIKRFVASADTLLPTEKDIHLKIENTLKKLKPEEIKSIADDFTNIQIYFLMDKKHSTRFSAELSKPQLDFALEVLFVGMADFYCQQDGPAKGLAETFTILNFADQEKGARLWNYTYEQAYDRLHLILDWSQKYPEILDAIRLGAKILSEKGLSTPNLSNVSLTNCFKKKENLGIYEFFKSLKFN